MIKKQKISHWNIPVPVSLNDAFIVKVVDDLDDAVKLMEVGFEFHTEIAGHKIFRKRK